ncbi:hypothetical protein [Nonomuraea sp. C10]|uniref:hypothetical protein n=1 Tax=Nonomuraea sp. C10 TaxID=2600577 RepID=UPI001650BB4E|nr:hypothetical protein [Nonomuraea sp. C10]
MGQLVHAVRAYGAAGVVVGVDERGPQAGGAQDRVQVQAEFGGDGVVGAEAGGRDDTVRGEPPFRAAGLPGDQFDAGSARSYAHGSNLDVRGRSTDVVRRYR